MPFYIFKSINELQLITLKYVAQKCSADDKICLLFFVLPTYPLK